MIAEEMKKRTKAYALQIIQLISEIPETRITRVIGNQLLRSGTSIGANYRATCRARSKADFIAKMGIVQEEADETAYWLELLTESGIISKEKSFPLINEAYEMVAISVSSLKTAKN